MTAPLEAKPHAGHEPGRPWELPSLAAFLNVSKKTLERAIKAEKLKAIRINRRVLVPDSEYLECRRCDSKPSTIANIYRVIHDLTAFYGRETDLRKIAVSDAERFKSSYYEKKLAPATIRRQLKWAKLFFNLALKAKAIAENPFAEVKGKSYTPPERRYYLTSADTHKLLASRSRRPIVAHDHRLGPLRRVAESVGTTIAEVGRRELRRRENDRDLAEDGAHSGERQTGDADIRSATPIPRRRLRVGRTRRSVRRGWEAGPDVPPSRPR